MNDKDIRFADVVKHGCPELEHIGEPLTKLETEWAGRFTQISNELASSNEIHKKAFDIAKQVLIEQVRHHQVPNGQLWEMRHPIWESYDCGLVFFDITDDGTELIELQTTQIKGLVEYDHFVEKQDVDYAGDELTYVRLELMNGSNPVVRIEDIKLEAATDHKTQCAVVGSLLTTLSFARLDYCKDSTAQRPF